MTSLCPLGPRVCGASGLSFGRPGLAEHFSGPVALSVVLAAPLQLPVIGDHNVPRQVCSA